MGAFFSITGLLGLVVILAIAIPRIFIYKNQPEKKILGKKGTYFCIIFATMFVTAAFVNIGSISQTEYSKTLGEKVQLQSNIVTLENEIDSLEYQIEESEKTIERYKTNNEILSAKIEELELKLQPVDEEAIKRAEEQAKLDVESYKAQCKKIGSEFSYKDLMRYPEEYKGELVTIDLKISQTMDYSRKYYRCYADKNGRNAYYGDEYYVSDYRTTDDTKLLDEDIIRVYGTFDGLEVITRALTSTSEEIPKIKMLYAEIIDE